MADISKIKLPSGTTYDIKDSVARETKIDKPSTEGTSGQVLSTDGNGGTAWADQPDVITGIHVGETAPTDPNVQVWLQPDGESDVVGIEAEATQLPAGSSPTAEFDATGDVLTLQLGLPAPEKGDRGDTVIIASKYSELTFPVAEGTYCLYNDVPYVANQTISTSEAWTAAHWDQVSFEDEIGELKNAVDNNITNAFVLELGTLNSSDGKPSPDIYRVRTADFIDASLFGVIKFSESLMTAFFAFNSEKVKIASTTWTASNDVLYTINEISSLLSTSVSDIHYIKVIFRYADSHAFASASELDSLVEYKNIGYYQTTESILKGKKISIYGDSISTYADWIPTGNVTYYTGNNAGVKNVNETWWKKVINALKLDLVVNNSWSGRAVSSIRDGESAHTTDAGYKEANVLQLSSGSTTPEIIIVKLGINDFNNNALLGDYDGSTALPTNPAKFLDAYAIMLNLIMTNFPLADVYCCTLMQCERTGATGFPEVNGNGDTLIKWNNSIKTLAHAFGAKVLEHDICGITYYNMSTYMGDYASGTGLHPNRLGHSLIANETIKEMDNTVRIRF